MGLCKECNQKNMYFGSLDEHFKNDLGILANLFRKESQPST